MALLVITLQLITVVITRRQIMFSVILISTGIIVCVSIHVLVLQLTFKIQIIFLSFVLTKWNTVQVFTKNNLID